MSMPEYVARNVTVIDFSDPRNIHIPQIYELPSSIIKFKSRTVDIGANCYSVREVNKHGVACSVKKNSRGVGVIRVCLGSLEEKRIALLKRLIEYMAHRSISVSQDTLYKCTTHLLPFFRFYWSQADLNYFEPENRLHFEEAARRYSASLNAKNNISLMFKHTLTSAVFNFAEFIYDGEDLRPFDYDLVSSPSQGSRSGTKPLLPDEQKLALALRSTIFDGVVDLLTNKKTFPHPISVPKACNELNDIIWLGYSPWHGGATFPRLKEFEKHQPREWFNRELGVLVTKKQWIERTDHKSTKSARDSWKSVQGSLEAINQDDTHTKKSLAEFAGMCFLDYLMSMTSMNQQSALDLPWFGGYFVQKADQGNKNVVLITAGDQAGFINAKQPAIYLRSIKNRKGYQPVEVTISNRVLPKFKMYLQLREYYLKGESDSRLFPFSVVMINNRRDHLIQKFPEIPKLRPLISRANLSDAILTQVNDPRVAAEILQNAPGTIIKHYAAGTQKAHIQGVGGFFNALGDQIRDTRNVTESEMETSVGRCENGGANPAPLPDAPIESNCTQQEGCFFCKHYSVHADEVDIRKLLSVLYYINKGATRAFDISHFNELFGLVIQRIKGLLEQIESISTQKKQLVSRIKNEIYREEALDEYWLCKLNRLDLFMGER